MKHLTIILVILTLSLVSGGPGAVLISNIKPDGGGDGDARRDLRAMSNEVMTPGAAPGARAELEADLLEGTGSVTDNSVKAHLIRELEVVGAQASVAPLGELLTQSADAVFFPALSTLGYIYSSTKDPDVPAVIRTALLSESSDARLAALMQAAGEVRDADAQTHGVLVTNAAKTEWSLRGAALRALTNIGSTDARQTLADALGTAADSYQLSKVIAWNFMYARRLAQVGLKDDATAIAGEIDTYAANNTLGGCQGSVHAIMCADAVLKEIPSIQVSVEPMTDKTLGDAPSIQIENGFKVKILSEGAYEIRLTDVLGKVLWSRKGSQPGSYAIPTASLSVGVYAIRVNSGGKIMVKHAVFH